VTRAARPDKCAFAGFALWPLGPWTFVPSSKYSLRALCGGWPFFKSEKWEAVRPGIQTLLQEVDGVVNSDPDVGKDCLLGTPLMNSLRVVLKDKGWLAKVNAHLGQHGLIADLASNRTGNSQRFLDMKIYALGNV
jgi:hypothetical protein